jgi:MHS family proline/betaine transporter-like MFS transporter
MSVRDIFSGDRSVKSRQRAIVASVVGNVVEFYDFTIFGFFAIYIGRAFFPSHDPFASLLASLAAFGAGFLMRPIGGLVMGPYADRYGRKSALIVTMTVMAVATGIIGIIPSYESIGIWAPLLLVACRLAQGFSTGGEWGGAVIFLVEHAPAKRRGFFSSWSQAGIMLGTLCGSTSALAATALLDESSMGSWGWRIPFLIGFVLMPIGYWLRVSVDETPEFKLLLANNAVASTPLKETFSSQKTAMFKLFAIASIWTAASYVLFVYLPSFGAEVLGIPLKQALGATTVASLTALLLFPLFGMLSDRFGRRRILQTANVGFLLTMFPLFSWMSIDRSFISFLSTSVVAGVLVAALGGAGPALLAEIVPPRLRSTAIGVGYNLAVISFGGFAPLVCTYLIRVTGQVTAPAFLLIACSMVSIIGLAQHRVEVGDARHNRP